MWTASFQEIYFPAQTSYFSFFRLEFIFQFLEKFNIFFRELTQKKKMKVLPDEESVYDFEYKEKEK